MDRDEVLGKVLAQREALAAAGTWDAFVEAVEQAWEVIREVIPSVPAGDAEVEVPIITLARDLVYAAGASERVAAHQKTREVTRSLMKLAPIIVSYQRAVEVPRGERIRRWEFPAGVSVPEPVVPPLGVDRVRDQADAERGADVDDEVPG